MCEIPIHLKPSKAIIDEVPLANSKAHPDRPRLRPDRHENTFIYLYLLQAREDQGDQKRKTYRLDSIIAQPNSCALYYLKDGPGRSFVKKETHAYPLGC